MAEELRIPLHRAYQDGAFTSLENMSPDKVLDLKRRYEDVITMEFKPIAISMSIQQRWLDKIISGEKTEEYRPLTDYWKNRIASAIGHEIVTPEYVEVSVSNNALFGHDMMETQKENGNFPIIALKLICPPTKNVHVVLCSGYCLWDTPYAVRDTVGTDSCFTFFILDANPENVSWPKGQKPVITLKQR